MWAYAQGDGRPPKMGGTLCWMLLSVEEIAKCHIVAIWGRRKTSRRSQQLHKAEVYETRQLWLERNVV